MVVAPVGGASGVARRVLGGPTARRRLTDGGTDGGHTAGVCPTSKEEAVLAVTSEAGLWDDEGRDGTFQTSAFKAEETGERGDALRTIGDCMLVSQVGDEACICNSRASAYMTRSADRMANYYECSCKLRITDGRTQSVEGYGVIGFVFRPGDGLVGVLLTIVA